ncbi:MAG: phosphoribosylamine--glycine ligase [Bradymonadaceae bacterium]|nr:phosphoribosylamine--glycine ligase [Lujinxingiaceae bacterium]
MSQRSFLVLGSGGREHALAWRLGQADDQPIVYVAPGNDGIAADPSIRGGCVAIAGDDLQALADFAAEQAITLTVVGPEVLLCAGVVDAFEARGLAIFGPRKGAAELEGSKAFAKDVMRAAGVPTADFEVFEQVAAALQYARKAKHPLVIKADGLAAGKGVVISADLATSEATLTDFLANQSLGSASSRVVIEQFLEGTEMSFMVITDGEHVLTLPTSQDHKRVGDGDTGPNTGGMGAFSPSPLASAALEAHIVETVIRPVLSELERRGRGFRGFLYAGLMLKDGEAMVLEFNVRLGDPETQALMLAIEDDLGALLQSALDGSLKDGRINPAHHASCIVMASRGYPAATDRGHIIEGLEEAGRVEGTKVFHAGTKKDAQGRLVNAAGRVLGVTARGRSAGQARERAYAAVASISWDGAHYRRDIGQ